MKTVSVNISLLLENNMNYRDVPDFGPGHFCFAPTSTPSIGRSFTDVYVSVDETPQELQIYPSLAMA